MENFVKNLTVKILLREEYQIETPCLCSFLWKGKETEVTIDFLDDREVTQLIKDVVGNKEVKRFEFKKFVAEHLIRWCYDKQREELTSLVVYPRDFSEDSLVSFTKYLRKTGFS
jgi:hypothetical protein